MPPGRGGNPEACGFQRKLMSPLLSKERILFLDVGGQYGDGGYARDVGGGARARRSCTRDVGEYTRARNEDCEPRERTNVINIWMFDNKDGIM
jgi:hypothetical protein